MTPSYRETVPIARWVVLALTGLLAVCVIAFTHLRSAVAADAPSAGWLWDAIWLVPLLVAPGVLLVCGRLVVLVEEGTLFLLFGFVRAIEQKIPLGLIARAENVTYRPIRQFGGWGIRRGIFAGAPTAVYSMTGSDGVLLTLARPIDTLFLRTDRVLIGSSSHGRLAEHLNALIR